MNNKGISMVLLIITMVVLIIIASIVLIGSTEPIELANKAKITEELSNLRDELIIYHEHAILNDKYKKNRLEWDGISTRAENTAKLIDGVNEDTPEKIFSKKIDDIVKGKIFINKGKLRILRTK